MIYNSVLGAFSTRYSIRMYVQFTILDLQLKTLLKHHFPKHTYLLSAFTANLITLAVAMSLRSFYACCSLSHTNWKRFDCRLQDAAGTYFFQPVNNLPLIFVPFNKAIIIA